MPGSTAQSPIAPLGEKSHDLLHATDPTYRRITWWQWPHVLSLDAPIVALVWQRWWAQAMHVEISWSQVCVLGLSVWLIYLADRLADIFRAEPGEVIALRHAFHAHKRALLSTILLPVGAVLVLVAPTGLSQADFRHGLLFLSLAIVYFWLIHGRRRQSWTLHVPKEAVVGVLFAVGTAFFPWSRLVPTPHEVIGGVGLFAMLCFCNCALITSWESHPRDVGNPASILNAFPRLTRCLRTGCVVLACLAGAGAALTGNALFLPLVASSLGLAMLDYHRNRLSPDSLRILADAVLLTPMLAGSLPLH